MAIVHSRGWTFALLSAITLVVPPVAGIAQDPARSTDFAVERTARLPNVLPPMSAPPGKLVLPPTTQTDQKSLVPVDSKAAPAGDVGSVALDDLIRFALERNPRLVRASFSVEAARGRTVQAGLYPNPVLTVTGDELGDRTGPAGIWTAPQLSQEIVTGRKLSLSQAVAAKEIDQTTLAVLAERYRLIGDIRSAFFEVAALQRRAEILAELVKLAEQSASNGKRLHQSGNLPRLDLVQLEVELERVRAEQDAANQELPAAFRRLSVAVGDSRLPNQRVAATFELPLPEYDLEKAREIVAATHPEVRSARVAVERARLGLERARAETIPNLTVTSGYVRQNQNKSSDWMIGVSLPIPAWNRNQGNIRVAEAEIGSAAQDIGRVENEVTDRLAIAFRIYSAAKVRAERYRTQLVPKAEETFALSSEAFRGGQFEYLRVLQAQRSLSEARLEYARSLGEAWRAAGEISGLLLEEAWPPKPMSNR